MSTVESIRIPIRLIRVRESRRDDSDFRLVVANASRIWVQAAIELELVVHDVIASSPNEALSGILLAVETHPEEASRASLENLLRALKDLLTEYDDGQTILLCAAPLPTIWDWQGGRRDHLNGVRIGLTRFIVLSDTPQISAARVLAHEIGHLLGLEHVEGEPERLMAQGTDGTYLTSEEVAQARDTGTKLFPRSRSEDNRS